MQTQEIPQNEWRPFLDDFSKRHEGDLVTIELLGADIGAQAEARAVPLVGVTLDAEQSRQIDVIVGQEPRSHIMHPVHQPSHVRVACDERGRETALQIESESGPTTLVRLGETYRTTPQP